MIDVFALSFVVAQIDGIFVVVVFELRNLFSEDRISKFHSNLSSTDSLAIGAFPVDGNINFRFFILQIAFQLFYSFNSYGIQVALQSFRRSDELVEIVAHDLDGNGLSGWRTIGFFRNGNFSTWNNSLHAFANFIQHFLGAFSISVSELNEGDGNLGFIGSGGTIAFLRIGSSYGNVGNHRFYQWILFSIFHSKNFVHFSFQNFGHRIGISLIGSNGKFDVNIGKVWFGIGEEIHLRLNNSN